jgi:hypothetical protein
MSDPIEVVSERAVPSATHSPTLLTLYGMPSNTLEGFLHAWGPGEMRVSFNVLPTGSLPYPYLTAQIYGYAYQGHCYNFPEPMIFVVPNSGAPATGFGYGVNYTMWTVEKLDRTLQFQTTNDTFEEIILRRSVGAAKQPIAYHSAVQVAHRGGKLTE